jgi:DNA modification methylase
VKRHDWGVFSIHEGDCREEMRAMAAGSVQCCVTSPPYFGLRDYGHAGQIGLEATPAEFVARMVEVFREVRRVLRDDGTLWLNLGDSYANDGKWGGSTGGKHAAGLHGDTGIGRERKATGLKPKELMGIPWRVAFALQDDGWYLRQDIIWHKPNPMPESVTDRCTKAHEYVFMLTKSPRYYFNSGAMKEPAVGGMAGNTKPTKGARAYAEGATEHRTAAGLHAWADRQRKRRDSFKREDSKRVEAIPGQSVGTHRPDRDESAHSVETRNRRSVWTVATRPYKEAHFATYPPALIEPCILAGSKPGDLVLDPFGGSGTTAEVAVRNGRKAVLCELNPAYVDLALRRVANGVFGRGTIPEPPSS